MGTCESPVVDFLVNPGAYEITPQRSRLQSYPPNHPSQQQQQQQLLPKSLLSPLHAITDPDEDDYRCFSLPRFDKVPIPDPAPLSSLSAHDLMGLVRSASSEQLRQREEELTEQHRKVVQERLAEQEEERDARQRLEDIINMCANFVSSGSAGLTGGQFSSTGSVVAAGAGAAAASASAATTGASCSSSSSASAAAAAAAGASLPSSSAGAANGHSPPNRPLQLKSPPGSRKSPPSTIGIKTNGSLKATTPSSEDELAAINNVADLAGRTPVSPASPPQSPRNRIKTVPGIPSPKDPILGATSPSYHHPQQQHHHHRPLANGISASGVNGGAATASSGVSASLPPTGGASATAGAGGTAGNSMTGAVSGESKVASAAGAAGGLGSVAAAAASTGTASQGLLDKMPARSSSLQKMAAHIHAAQASLLQSQFAQLEAAFKEQIDELQMELALVTGELCDEQFSLKEDLIQYGKLEAEQEMFVGETLRDKEDEERRLQLAGERILKWQELTVKMAETLDDPVSPALEREISERLENEVECLEAEKRAYEDLEFQIMESTARRDERIDEVNQRVIMMGRLIGQKEARIEELQLQQRAIADELEAKKREWADQQRSHQNSLRVVQQAQQQSSLDSESFSGSESDTESEYQHSNCGSEMVSSSTESEELFSPKTSAALGQMGTGSVSLRNSNNNNNNNHSRRMSQRPLTCYLPVFPDQGHFDLRAHITSCGHQLEICAQDVSVDSNTCRGYLYKLGSASRWWKKRWFVFDRASRALMYFIDKTERKLKGVIHFESIDDVYVDHGNKKMAAFCVKTLDRIYHLSSTSPEAMRLWVDVIFSGAHGYNRFLGQD